MLSTRAGPFKWCNIFRSAKSVEEINDTEESIENGKEELSTEVASVATVKTAAPYPNVVRLPVMPYWYITYQEHIDWCNAQSNKIAVTMFTHLPEQDGDWVISNTASASTGVFFAFEHEHDALIFCIKFKR